MSRDKDCQNCVWHKTSRCPAVSIYNYALVCISFEPIKEADEGEEQ